MNGSACLLWHTEQTQGFVPVLTVAGVDVNGWKTAAKLCKPTFSTGKSSAIRAKFALSLPSGAVVGSQERTWQDEVSLKAYLLWVIPLRGERKVRPSWGRQTFSGIVKKKRQFYSFKHFVTDELFHSISQRTALQECGHIGYKLTCNIGLKSKLYHIVL